jgi:hypothetical protein
VLLNFINRLNLPLTNCCSSPLVGAMTGPQHVYEVRPRKDQRGVDLISDALPFGALWYGEPDAISNAIGYAKGRLCFRSGEMAFPIPCGTVRHVISCIGTDWTVNALTEFQRRSLRMPQVHA